MYSTSSPFSVFRLFETCDSCDKLCFCFSVHAVLHPGRRKRRRYSNFSYHLIYTIIYRRLVGFGCYYMNFFFSGFFLFVHSTGEILYRVELPYMEEITLIYLENSDNYDDYSKCVCCDCMAVTSSPTTIIHHPLLTNHQLLHFH